MLNDSVYTIFRLTAHIIYIFPEIDVSELSKYLGLVSADKTASIVVVVVCRYFK